MATDATILRIALPTPLRRYFDYLPPEDIDNSELIPGIRVQVPFQSRSLVGILISTETQSDVPYGKLKRATAILDTQPLFSEDVFKLCQWAAEYYHAALGEVLASALPVLLRKGKNPEDYRSKFKINATQQERPILNAAQAKAVDTIQRLENQFNVLVLDGVTGSGKTEVYLRAIEHVLQTDKQCLVLVPEISLTPQTISRFQARFAVPITALHSNLTEKKRLQAWEAARKGDARIIIGTRSAVFTPFQQLGLIVIDEEHDVSFKQQDRFRYHARDLAVMRANMLNIPIVLGSATPSLETVLNVKRKRYHYLALPQRAGGAALPDYQIVDLRQTRTEEGLSPALLHAIKQHLMQDQQVMLFLNRRGFSPVLYCLECAWMASCKHCDARMVYHRTANRLQCHHCDTKAVIPKSCPGCKSMSLQPVGLGTQRLEQALSRHFPTVPIIRVDRDSTRKKGAMQALFDQIHAHPKAILLGTQMLAKGHHFPNVTLVGIIDADSGLFSADFRGAEQMGQLLLQVAGRAGREEKAGTVMIQTHHPDHPLLTLLLQQGYASFSQSLLQEREQTLFPPYAHFAVFRAESSNEQQANQFLEKIKALFTEINSTIDVLGPVPARMAKRKGQYCQHLLVKTQKRSLLQQFLKAIMEKIEPTSSSVKWVLDVDPLEV